MKVISPAKVKDVVLADGAKAGRPDEGPLFNSSARLIKTLRYRTGPGGSVVLATGEARTCRAEPDSAPHTAFGAREALRCIETCGLLAGAAIATRAGTRTMASMGLWAILAFAIAAGLGLPAAAARGAAGDGCPSALVEAIPPRPSHAASASDFVQRSSALSEAARDKAVAAELMAGNLPVFLRRLRPVALADPRAEAHVTI
ncbi:MAG TPA: hypothetical protein VFZ10_21510 [Geminicoccaceae bacterium]